MRLNLTEVSSDKFTVGKNKKTLFSEASDLGNVTHQPLYDDACDVGIAIRSVKTGILITFHLTENIFANGEVSGWKYEPLPSDVAANPECAGLVVTIFND